MHVKHMYAYLITPLCEKSADLCFYLQHYQEWKTDTENRDFTQCPKVCISILSQNLLPCYKT